MSSAICCSYDWSLLTFPNFQPLTSGSISIIQKELSSYTWIALSLSMLTIILVFASLFRPRFTILASALGVSLLTLIFYTILIAEAVAFSCPPNSPICASGPIGSYSASGSTLSWGFGVGFYIFAGGAVISALRAVFPLIPRNRLHS